MQIRVEMLADCSGKRKNVSCIIDAEQKDGKRILSLWGKGMDAWKTEDCIFLDKLFCQLSRMMAKSGKKPLSSFEDMYLEEVKDEKKRSALGA